MIPGKAPPKDNKAPGGGSRRRRRSDDRPRRPAPPRRRPARAPTAADAPAPRCPGAAGRARRPARRAGAAASPTCSGTSAAWPTRWRSATTSSSTCSTRKAAELQVVDAELGELDRLLRTIERASPAPASSCGAPHSRGAAFCWSCGTMLRARRAGRDLTATPHDDLPATAPRPLTTTSATAWPAARGWPARRSSSPRCPRRRPPARVAELRRRPARALPPPARPRSACSPRGSSWASGSGRSRWAAAARPGPRCCCPLRRPTAPVTGAFAAKDLAPALSAPLGSTEPAPPSTDVAPAMDTGGDGGSSVATPPRPRRRRARPPPPLRRPRPTTTPAVADDRLHRHGGAPQRGRRLASPWSATTASCT